MAQLIRHFCVLCCLYLVAGWRALYVPTQYLWRYCLFRLLLLWAHHKSAHASKPFGLHWFQGSWNFKITRTYSQPSVDIPNCISYTELNEAINLVMVDCSNQADKNTWADSTIQSPYRFLSIFFYYFEAKNMFHVFYPSLTDQLKTSIKF